MNSVENISSDSASPVGTTRSEPTLIAVNTSDVAVRRDGSPPAFESIGDLDSAVSTLAISPIAPVERGHGVLAVLRRLVHAESGSYNIGAGLGRFLERMWSGPCIEALVRSVHLRAVALAEGRVGDGLDPMTLVHDLRSIVEWYTQRKMSLNACRREGFVEADPEALFNLHIAHDVRRWGVDGMIVSCGLRFIARAHETVWFKVSARHEGQAIGARATWASWCDETDTVSARQGKVSRAFAAMSPLRPLRQRCVIDRVELFVPYAALDLPGGRHEIDLEAGIYAQSGELIVSAVVPETVQLSPSSGDVSRVPAPQALGVWSADPVTGHELVVTGSHVRFEGDPGWEEQVLETRVDIALVGLAGERLELEARLRRDDGTVVGLLDRPAGGTLEPCLARVALLPQQVVSKLSGVRVLVPLGDLDLLPGHHDLFVETVVVTSDGKIVCGAFEPVTIDLILRGGVPRDGVDSDEPTVAADTELDIGAVVVAPSVRNEQVMLDVTVNAASRDWESSHYRLLVSLECRDGTPIRNAGAADRPVLRSVWFGGEKRAPGEVRTVQVSFDAREFARFLKTRGATERDVVTRIVVANEAGRMLFETTRIIASDFAAEIRAATPPEKTTAPVRPVDVTLDNGEGMHRTLRVALNVHRFALPGNRCTVYYECIDRNGEPHRTSPGVSDLCGEVVPIAFPFVGRGGQRRWYQTTVEIPYAAPAPGVPRPVGVRLSVFSDRGEFWETVYYPFSADRERERSEPRSLLAIRQSGDPTASVRGA